MKGSSRYAVVIPAYNEARTIHDVATRTLRYVSSVFVIDDGSTDGTVDALRGLPVTVLKHSRNLGKAAALLHGMRKALTSGASAIISLDGDGQHKPEDIPTLITMHRRLPVAIIVGSRLHQPRNIPKIRYVANRIANFWISWAAGQRILDSQSGFRLYPATVLQTLRLPSEWSTGFVFESEVLIEAGRKAIPIRSVPVSVVYGRYLRRSHFRSVWDIGKITRMVAKKLVARRLDIPALLQSRRYASTSPGLPVAAQVSNCPTKPTRRLLLIFAEAVSLAHVARAITLAQSLDLSRYDIHFACDPRFLSLFGDLPFPVHVIRSIQSHVFQDRLANGDSLYTTADLRHYVQEDLRLMTELEPDLVIGDFRLSLSVSARLSTIPYATITNAHWSPYARRKFPVPELAITKRFGPCIAQGLFDLIRPLVFAQQTYALNRIRRDHGMPAVGYTLPQQLSDADYTLYADLPQLVPTVDPPPHHRYIGPVVWSFGWFPQWWSSLRDDVRTAYVSMGMSGKSHLGGMIARSLAHMGWQVLLATTDDQIGSSVKDAVWTARYLPGTPASRRADLVVCNGGSGMVYQALAAGTPILGIPNNLDQYLMMEYVQRVEAGECIRAGMATPELVRRSAHRIVESVRYKTSAAELSDHISQYQTNEQFQSCVDDILENHAEPLTPVRECHGKTQRDTVFER